MEMTAPAIAAYFDRIGYYGPRAPTLAVLQDLHARHPTYIPFESLDSFMGRPVPIDPTMVSAKLVGARRGGYCHEHNLLFHDVLATLGFRVTALGGRVLWMDPHRDAPLTHRMTLVDLPEGRFLADVGFGGQTATVALRLEPGLEQPTPQGTYRLTRSGDVFETEMKLPDRWAKMYRFRLDMVNPIDFEVANWFTATHPRSRFTQNLVAARIVGTTRITLLNRHVTIRQPDGSAVERELAGMSDLARVLDEDIQITSPVPVAAIWQKLLG